MTAEDMKILKLAREKGIIIIGSVGNFWEEKVYYPANALEVWAVAGVDSIFKKEAKSNFGMNVDFSAPASNIFGAHPDKDNAYIFENGTSPACAFISACTAILLSESQRQKSEIIYESMVNTATVIDTFNIQFGGKLGAGVVNLENAIDYLKNPKKRQSYLSKLRSKGIWRIDKSNSINEVNVQPVGGYSGFFLKFKANKGIIKKKNTLEIIINDTLWNEYSFKKLPDKIFIPSSSFKLKLKSSRFKQNDSLMLAYEGKTIDSTTLFCSGTKYYTNDLQSICDGSGESNYSNNCDCKWLITAPPGKTIKITFDWIHTQSNVDFIYLADGKTVIPENVFAMFSGYNTPPVVYSRTNEIVVWFVTDKTLTGRGFQFHYEFVGVN
jgi:hypothetical protein